MKLELTEREIELIIWSLKGESNEDGSPESLTLAEKLEKEVRISKKIGAF